MSLILCDADGRVTQVDLELELPSSSSQFLMGLFDGVTAAPHLAFAYGACGIVYATPESTFRLDTIPAAGSPIIFPLVDRIGRARALELLISGQTLSSDQALSFGVIDGITSISEFESKAAEIAKLSRSSITQATSLVRRQKGLTAKQAMLLERYNFALRFASADQKEGIDAFLTKRKPKFDNDDSH